MIESTAALRAPPTKLGSLDAAASAVVPAAWMVGCVALVASPATRPPAGVAVVIALSG